MTPCLRCDAMTSNANSVCDSCEHAADAAPYYLGGLQRSSGFTPEQIADGVYPKFQPPPAPRPKVRTFRARITLVCTRGCDGCYGDAFMLRVVGQDTPQKLCASLFSGEGDVRVRLGDEVNVECTFPLDTDFRAPAGSRCSQAVDRDGQALGHPFRVIPMRDRKSEPDDEEKRRKA